MKHTLITLLLASAFAGAAFAQTAPVGDPDAKGNSPVKAAHTVNDGAAKPAANSFTRGQAIKHIEKSGYSGVAGLTEGRDGVWRGKAMKNGASVNVAMDFKGNVTEGMAPVAARRMMAPPTVATPTTDDGAAAPAAAQAPEAAATSGMSRHHGRHHRHWRRHHRHHGGGGHGMSGVDRNKNGISDKEDRAIARH